MQSPTFLNLLVVVAAALAAPLALGLAPRLRLPTVVLEILLGIAIGPAGLGLAAVDTGVATLALLGFAFLLFLAGSEIAFDTLGRLLGPAALGFALSLALALAIGYGLGALGIVSAPLFVAITLAATALGIVVGVLTSAHQASTRFGQLVIANASLADFGTVILLSVFFSRASAGAGAQLLVVGGLALVAVAVALAARRAERWGGLRALLGRFDSGASEVRVRAALLLLVGFAALAERLGLEVILGAFLAGAVLALIDGGAGAAHEAFRHKLGAIGYGVFIPIFFVASGMRFDLAALLASPQSLLLVPLLLGALLLVRGLPALLYRRLVGGRAALCAGLLQATSLPFIVAAVQIGLGLHVVGQSLGAALMATGLLSVLLFPLGALALLPTDESSRETAPVAALVREAPRVGG